MTTTKVRLVKGDTDGEEIYAYQLPDGSILQPTVQVDVAGNPVEGATETTMAELKGVADAISTAAAAIQAAVEALNIKTPAISENQRVEEEDGLSPAFVTDTNMMHVLGSQSLVDNQRVNVNNILARKPMVVKNLNALNSECRIDCEGMNTVTLQIAGTWSGTLSFFASVDGGDFQTILPTRINTNNLSATRFPPLAAAISPRMLSAHPRYQGPGCRWM